MFWKPVEIVFSGGGYLYGSFHCNYFIIEIAEKTA